MYPQGRWYVYCYNNYDYYKYSNNNNDSISLLRAWQQPKVNYRQALEKEKYINTEVNRYGKSEEKIYEEHKRRTK
jgi:hypothetical protein